MKKLLKSSVKDIYIALDSDAVKKAIEYTEKFINLGKRVYLVNLKEKDPSEMGFNAFTHLIQTAEEVTLNTLMRYKLESI